VAAWQALVELYLDQGRAGRVKLREGTGRFSPVAALWPLSQVIAAGLHVGRLTGDATVSSALFAVLEQHRVRRGDGYLPFPGQGPLYFDDNAWVGLDQVQAALLWGGATEASNAFADQARRTLEVVAAGQVRAGGVRWREAPDSPVNTCATAPAIQLALRLALIDEGPGRAGLRAFAASADDALSRQLRRDDHLYADHVERDGRVDHALWAYNQGTPVGADVLWWRLEGDEARLDRAAATAAASLRHFDTPTLWAHPPVFVAIWFRNLLALHAVREVPELMGALDRYLAAVWEHGRDPTTGAFDRGGIGRYDNGGSIDHAGIVQLLALRAWPEPWWPDIC